MRAARVFALITLLVAGLAGTSHAQYSNATGTFDVKIAVAPGLLPDAGASIPPELRNIDGNVYVGTLTVSGGGGGGYSVSFQGERADGAKLNINATFSSDWVGIKLGGVFIGTEQVSPAITGIDVAHLLSANINGVGLLDGKNQRVVAKIGPGGTVERFKVLPAPGPLR